jgi:hypothetical protein
MELQGEAPKLEEHPGFHQLIGRLSSTTPPCSATPLSSPRLDELLSQRSYPVPSPWTIDTLATGLAAPHHPLHQLQSRHRSRSGLGDQQSARAGPVEIADGLGCSNDFGLWAHVPGQAASCKHYDHGPKASLLLFLGLSNYRTALFN